MKTVQEKDFINLITAENHFHSPQNFKFTTESTQERNLTNVMNVANLLHRTTCLKFTTESTQERTLKNECGQSFVQLSEFKYHYRMHTGEKP